MSIVYNEQFILNSEQYSRAYNEIYFNNQPICEQQTQLPKIDYKLFCHIKIKLLGGGAYLIQICQISKYLEKQSSAGMLNCVNGGKKINSLVVV